jgi:peptidoglycan/LPS O-acetylase OafA/YrhL
MMVAYWFFWWWPQGHLIELLIINATFVFNFFPGLHESIVAAGWSVGVEMPFYFAFPFILGRVRRLRDAMTFLVAAGIISVASGLLFAGTPGYAYMAFTSNIAIFAIGLLATLFRVLGRSPKTPNPPRLHRCRVVGRVFLLPDLRRTTSCTVF